MDVDATKEMDVLGLSGLFFSFAAVETITVLSSPATDADVATIAVSGSSFFSSSVADVETAWEAASLTMAAAADANRLANFIKMKEDLNGPLSYLYVPVSFFHLLVSIFQSRIRKGLFAFLYTPHQSQIHFSHL